MGGHSDNKSGDFSTTSRPGGGQNVNLISPNASPSTQVDVGTDSNLPANKATEGTVNYFGSSFSGADVKVMVNLYDLPGSLQDHTTEMEEELQIAEGVVSAANTLIPNIQNLASVSQSATYSVKQDALLSAAGLSIAPRDDIEVEIRKIILNTTNWTKHLYREASARTQAYNALEILIKEKESEVSELQQKVGKLKDSKPPSASLELGTLQTLSIQSHREKFAVRACGHTYIKGYTRGPRTIAGSMIFTVFHEHVLASVMRTLAYAEQDPEISSLLSDQLPPLDLTVVLANEYGQVSEFRIYGVEFLNDSTTYSIEDLLTETVIQYTARDYDPLASKGKIALDRSLRDKEGAKNPNSQMTGTQLLTDNASGYENYLEKLKVRRRILNR